MLWLDFNAFITFLHADTAEKKEEVKKVKEENVSIIVISSSSSTALIKGRRRDPFSRLFLNISSSNTAARQTDKYQPLEQQRHILTH